MAKRCITRREALALGGGIGGFFAAGASWAAPLVHSDEADSVVLNARVYTVEPGAKPSQAFATRGGRFLAVGSTEYVRRFMGRRTQVFDAQGATVVPGFVDCHNHAVGDVLLYDVIVGNPYEVEFVSIQSIIEKLRERAATTPPGYWVEGNFFDDQKVKDQRALNIRDLDQVSNVHPVRVQHRGGHTAYFNSKAMELAGITRDTPNPPGGTIDRDANGDLNGRVTDRALDRFQSVGLRPKYTEAEQVRRSTAAMAYISKQFVRYGLTSVHHEHFEGSEALRAIQLIRNQGELRHRVFFAVQGKQLDDLIDAGVRTDMGDEWLRIGGTVEHGADGSFSERTMAMSVPYPGMGGYRGNVTRTQEQLDEWVLRMQRAGIQVNCHCNGDVAIGAILTALERAQQAFPVVDGRPQLTHCTLINDSLVQRIKAIGAVPAPFNTYPYYNADKFQFYGQEIIRHCMAFRTFIDAGIIAAAGSDFPPGPFSPLMALQAMVTRKGWNGEVWGAEQRVSVSEALQINTLNGAYASHEEHIKGSITPGKLADYVVLADDPHTIDPEKIKDIKILRTVTGGNVVFQA